MIALTRFAPSHLGLACALHLGALVPLAWNPATPAVVRAAPQVLTQDPAEDPPVRAEELPPAALARVRENLRSVRLRLATEADHAWAWDELNALMNEVGFPTLVDAELTEQRALSLQILGQALQSAPYAVNAKGLATVLDKLEELGRYDPDVLALVRAAREGTAPDEASRIDQAVLVAVDSGNQAFLQQLGSRAVPGLRQAFLRDPDRFEASPAKDPLMSLVAHHPLELSELIGETLSHTSFYYRKSVMRAIQGARLTARAECYATSEGTPPPFLAQGALRFLERHVQDPDIGNEVRAELEPLMRMDALGPVLGRELVRLAREGEAQQVEQLVGLIDASRPTAGLREHLLAMLAEGQPAVRRAAARALLGYEDVTPLLALVDDADPLVRRTVAGPLLGLRSVHRMTARSEAGKLPTWSTESVCVPWSPTLQDRARRFLQDPDPEVRSGALYGLMNRPVRTVAHALPALRSGNTVTSAPSSGDWNRLELIDPVPLELLRPCVTDEAPMVRQRLLGVIELSPLDTRYVLIQELAQVVHPGEVEALTERLYNLPWWEAPERHVGVLRSLLARGEGILAPTDRDLVNHLRQMLVYAPGLDVVADWIVNGDDGALAEQLMRASWGRSGPDMSWLDAREDLVPALLVKLYELDPESTRSLARRRVPGSSARAALAATTVEHPVAVRVVGAALGVHGSSSAGLTDALLRAFALPGWDGLAPEEVTWTAETLADLVRDCEDADRERIGRAVLATEELPLYLAECVLDSVPYDGPSGAELGRAVLARWFDRPGARGDGPTPVVLRAMVRNAELRDLTVLLNAARQREIQLVAFEVLGQLRDPACLPVLAEVVRESHDGRVLRGVAEALPGFLSDEAAELLLEVATKAPEEELRTWCLEQLDRIRTFQEARERWADRRVRVQTREQVVAELLELLRAGEPAQRQQAARALATWEAVEAMPALIRLLSDPDPGLAAAAAEALDRLNALRVDTPELAPGEPTGDGR